MIGALDGAADLTSAAVKWMSGRLADRPGWRKPLILGGYLTAVLVRPLIAFAGAAWQIVGFRVIDRVGKGLRTPPRDALIAELTPPHARGRAFGFHRAADHLGAVVGAVAAWALLRSGASVRDVIGWSIFPGIVAFLALAILLRPGSRPSEAAAVVPAELKGDAVGRVFWAPVAALAGLTFARLHVVRSAFSYPGGQLTDRVGPRATVAAGGLLAALTLGGLALARAPGLAAAVFLCFGLVAGLTEAAERALVARLAPVRTGRGFGAYHALTGLAALPAGVFFGAVYERAGGPTALATSAGAVALVTVAWVAVAPRHQTQP